jgi:hypothetical protein
MWSFRTCTSDQSLVDQIKTAEMGMAFNKLSGIEKLIVFQGFDVEA